MNANQKLCCLMVATLTALVGCGSPCSGEVIDGNSACAEGCRGIEVLRFNSSCERESLTWCARRPELGTEATEYLINPETGDIYVMSGAVEEEFLDPIRLATSAERAFVRECPAP